MEAAAAPVKAIAPPPLSATEWVQLRTADGTGILHTVEVVAGAMEWSEAREVSTYSTWGAPRTPTYERRTWVDKGMMFKQTGSPPIRVFQEVT